MLYQLLKIPVRFALKIFCREIRLLNAQELKQAGPLLVTANHPNSFLDAIIIGAQFNHPVHFLARGDAFYKSWHNRLLRMLNMIPVYRLSEGRENLELNTHAFEACRQVLISNGIVLIFIEGICMNSHQLQPFKKGAARIALESRQLENFRVLPVGIAYNSMHRFSKTVVIEAGATINASRLMPFAEGIRNRTYFNEQLYSRIDHLVHVPDTKDLHVQKRIALMIPAMIGLILHMPLYLVLKTIVRRKTRGTVYYDSVLFGVLLVSYPAYLVLIAVTLALLSVQPLIVLTALVLHPLTAACAVRVFPAGVRADPC